MKLLCSIWLVQIRAHFPLVHVIPGLLMVHTACFDVWLHHATIIIRSYKVKVGEAYGIPQINPGSSDSAQDEVNKQRLQVLHRHTNSYNTLFLQMWDLGSQLRVLDGSSRSSLQHAPSTSVSTWRVRVVRVVWTWLLVPHRSTVDSGHQMGREH